MHYYIDGYNLFFKVFCEINPLEEKRGSLIDELNNIASTLNISLTVVFDSNADNSDVFASKKVLSNIEVVFSPSDKNADNYLIEILELVTYPKQATLITSDRPLAFQAKNLGINIISVEDFLRWIIKKMENKKLHDEKPYTACDSYNQKLLEIFEKRLNDDTQ